MPEAIAVGEALILRIVQSLCLALSSHPGVVRTKICYRENWKTMPSFSIRWTLPILIVAPIAATVVLSGWLTYRNGQRAIDELAIKINTKTTQSIEQHVANFLERPHDILQVNQAAISSNDLNLDSFSDLEDSFRNLTRAARVLDYIFYGNEQGDFIGVRTLSDNQFLLQVRDRATAPQRNTYLIEEGDKKPRPEETIEYDPRERPWYKQATETRQPTWSPVYPFASDAVLGITAASPIYRADNSLVGVLGIDLTLKNIGDFLETLEISPSGEAFIIERSGEIIASSTGESPFVEKEGEQERLAATDSQNRLIRDVAQELLGRHDSFAEIDDKQQLALDVNGSRTYVGITPVQDERGIDWLIVVSIPAADFKEIIYANTQSTVIVGSAVAIVAIILGLIVARSIIRPIQCLNLAAKAIEADEFKPDLLGDVVRRQDEIGELAQVFQNMATVISTDRINLTDRLNELQTEIKQTKRVRTTGSGIELIYLKELQQKAKRIREADNSQTDD